MKNLTKIAALPGSGGGCMSALAPEVAKQPKPTTYQLGPYFVTFGKRTIEFQMSVQNAANWEPKAPETITVWPTLEAFKATVQMKAPYFEEPKDWTPVYYKADHDELAFPPIDLGMVGE